MLHMKKWIALSLCMALLAGVAGCSGSMESVPTQPPVEKQMPELPKDATLSEEDAKLLTAAAVKLYQNCSTDGNLLISPLSVLCAVGMTANGACGNTEAQLEEFFGMDTAALDRCLYAWLSSQNAHEGLLAANSVWYSDASLQLREDFMNTVSDYFGVEVFQGPMNEDMRYALNSWVGGKTNDMIPELIDKIPENVVAYLVNALAFRCRWAEEYTQNKVKEGSFTTESGEERTVELMSSEESVYLENEDAVGFMKYYADDKYAFAALLPNEGTAIADFVAALDGETLYGLLKNAEPQSVNVKLPKFETEYDAELSGVFQKLGVTDAFDDTAADFSAMGGEKGDIYISRILHKTCLTVNETGTEAAAATAVEMMTKSMRPMRNKLIVLDRPFVYMIVDTEANIPVFIGTVTDIGD